MFLIHDSATHRPLTAWPSNSSTTSSRAARYEVPAPYTPLVSILIPAHNAEECIADTLHSALAQTWPRIEIIVVDDGSTDRTPSIVQQFHSRGVRLVLQKNLGASAARNKAFSLSHGDYIQWLDADDLLDPNKIAAQIEVLGNRPNKRTLLSSSWGMFLYRYDHATFTPTSLWCDLSPTEWLLHKMGENLYMQTATWLVSRELTEAAGPWDTRLTADDDGEYFCRVLFASEGVRFVPDAKVFYRGPGLAFHSLSHIGNSRIKREGFWLSMQQHIHTLRSLEESERVHIACRTYLQTSFVNFYPDLTPIMNHAQQIARELGGELAPPRLSWKYSWVQSLFGWDSAKRVQSFLLNLKWTVKRYYDKALYLLSSTRRHDTRNNSDRPINRVLSRPRRDAKASS